MDCPSCRHTNPPGSNYFLGSRGAAKPVAEIDPTDGAARVAAMTGTDVATFTRERPGMSAFVLEDGVVYHTYSTYARGVDGLWGMYQWLDRALRGGTRPVSDGAATTSTTSAEWRTALDRAWHAP